MARNMQPIAKRCKALDISPATMGYTSNSKVTKRDPKGNSRRKKSEYANQLNEKQKVKFVYGVLERQFRNYYEKAAKAKGQTGENLLVMLESRLDNVVFRSGFCSTRRGARQAVTHGHFIVNGGKVDIPSYLVKPGDIISIKEKSQKIDMFKKLRDEGGFCNPPSWVQCNFADLNATVTAVPNREEIGFPIEEHLIVELYSK